MKNKTLNLSASSKLHKDIAGQRARQGQKERDKMSYEIIRKIRIDQNKVLITCASNNVYPRTFEECESFSLSKILQEKGHDALELEIFKAYESGCFQQGSSKYMRALEVLRHLPEYKSFDWHLPGLGKDYDICQKNRETPAFDNLLKKALKTRLPKEKFIVFKKYDGENIYLWKITKRCASWIRERARAKIFKYEEDANNISACFQNSQDWQVARIT